MARRELPERTNTAPPRARPEKAVHPHESLIPWTGLQPSDSLLALQGAAGNAAVQRLPLRGATPSPPSVQRLLVDGATFLSETSGKKGTFKSIAKLLDDYNVAAAVTTKADAEYHACFDQLRELERKVHRWFSRRSAENQSLTEVPHADRLKRLLDQMALEHQELIEATKGDAEFLPFDTKGMQAGEIQGLKTLWQDIVQGRGKIKLVGSPGHTKRVLSEMAKILDTPTGRRLLAYLNAPSKAYGTQAQNTPSTEPDAPETAGADDPMTAVYVAESIDQLPDAVRTASKRLEQQQFSIAQALGEGFNVANVMDAPATGNEDPREYPTVASADEIHKIRDAAWEGKKGYIFGGRRFEFQKRGTGGFVLSFEGKSRSGGEDDHEILAPGFITLAHELGHVANFRSGAAMLHYQMEPSLTASLGGGATEEEAKFRWQNPEELLNIRNVENAVRDESDLSKRGSHIPFDSYLKMNRKKTLLAQFDASFGKSLDPYWEWLWTDTPIKDPVLRPLKVNLNGPWMQTILDNAEFGRQQEEIRAASRTVGPNQLIAAKKNLLAVRLGELDTKWKHAPKRTRDQKREYKKLKKRSKDEEVTLTAYGRLQGMAFADFLGEIDKLKASLPAKKEK